MVDFFIGCDTHKEKHFISIINPIGKVQKSFEINNSPKGWQEAISKVKKYPNRVWGIENSANFAKQFCKFLLDEGEVLKEVNPVFTGKSRKASTNRNKTDEIDSVVIAKVTRDQMDYLPDIQINKEQEELKAITRQRDELVKEQTRTKNRLHAKLTSINPMYKEAYGLLRNKSTLIKIEKEFSNSSDILKKMVLQDVRLLENLSKEISNLEKIMKEKQKKSTLLQNLDTIIGVDTILACKLGSLIGDIDKFKNSNRLASYAGIAPVTKSSGKSSKEYRNVGANRQLNHAFFMIALTQVKKDETAKEYYKDKLNNGKTKKQAIHCLMRRLVKIVWMMYKHNQPYRYQELQQAKNQLQQAA
jgi:transposase